MLKMTKDGFLFLDSDMHVFEPPDLFLEYMVYEDLKLIPRVQLPQSRYQTHRFTNAYGESIRKSVVSARWREIDRMINDHVDNQSANRYRSAVERKFDAASQVEAMDVEGCDVAVMFRTFPCLADGEHSPNYALALARAWNNWIADFCRYNPVRMKACAILPLHDVDMAVDEARRVKALGHVGVCMEPGPHGAHHLQDAYYDPLWTELETQNLAATFHPSANPNLESITNLFPGHTNSSTMTSAFMFSGDNMVAMTRMIVGGVLERHPRLRVAFLEGNAAWAPWLLYKLDKRWKEKGQWEEFPLSKRPSDYFLQQCYVSVDADEYLVNDVIQRLGSNNIVFSSDYPHADSEYPHATSTLTDILSAEWVHPTTQRILWDNCSRLYNISVPHFEPKIESSPSQSMQND